MNRKNTSNFLKTTKSIKIKLYFWNFKSINFIFNTKLNMKIVVILNKLGIQANTIYLFLQQNILLK